MSPGEAFAREMVEEYDKRLADRLRERITNPENVGKHEIEMIVRGANRYRLGLGMALIVYKTDSGDWR